MAANLRIPDGLPVEKEQIFRMAQQEMEYRVDLFNKLTQTCIEKCIERKSSVTPPEAGHILSPKLGSNSNEDQLISNRVKKK